MKTEKNEYKNKKNQGTKIQHKSIQRVVSPIVNANKTWYKDVVEWWQSLPWQLQILIA